jgi:hypothetical protein
MLVPTVSVEKSVEKMAKPSKLTLKEVKRLVL